MSPGKEESKALFEKKKRGAFITAVAARLIPTSTDADSKKASSPFLKKRTKKLLTPLSRALRREPRQRNQSFLLIFFKKEGLACFGPVNFRPIGITWPGSGTSLRLAQLGGARQPARHHPQRSWKRRQDLDRAGSANHGGQAVSARLDGRLCRDAAGANVRASGRHDLRNRAGAGTAIRRDKNGTGDGARHARDAPRDRRHGCTAKRASRGRRHARRGRCGGIPGFPGPHAASLRRIVRALGRDRGAGACTRRPPARTCVGSSIVFTKANATTWKSTRQAPRPTGTPSGSAQRLVYDGPRFPTLVGSVSSPENARAVCSGGRLRPTERSEVLTAEASGLGIDNVRVGKQARPAFLKKSSKKLLSLLSRRACSARPREQKSFGSSFRKRTACLLAHHRYQTPRKTGARFRNLRDS